MHICDVLRLDVNLDREEGRLEAVEADFDCEKDGEEDAEQGYEDPYGFGEPAGAG